MEYLKTYLTLVLFSLIKCDESNEIFTNENLDKNLGFYYEKVGKLRLYNDHWKILIHVNFQDLSEQYDRLIVLKQEINQLCLNSKTDLSTHCTNFLPQINQIVLSLQAQNLLISHIVGSETNLIHKRGLLDVVGKASKFLFGTLDEEDAKFYDEQIETLYQNQDQYQNLLKEQITIKESVVDHLNQTVQYIQEFDNKISKMIFKINKFQENINNNSLLVEKISAINEVFVIFISISDRFSIVQNHIIEILTYAMKGNLHPYVIDSKTLIAEMTKIKMYLPNDVDLPVTANVKNIKLLYKIINVNTYYSNKRLNFLLTIPLVRNLEFDIYKITSIPRHIKNNAFEILLPEKPFLAIDPIKQHYFSYNLEELHTCVQITKGNSICEQTAPIHISHTDDICERKLLEPTAEVPRTCTSRVMVINKAIYLQLAAPNSWIYVAPYTETILLQCEGKTMQKIVNGIGKIRLGKGCQSRSKTIILNTKSEFNQTVMLENFFNIVKIPNVEIDNHFLDILKENIDYPNCSYTYGISNQINNLKRISLGIDKIKSKTVPIKRIKYHSNSISLLSISLIVIGIVVLSLLIYNCMIILYSKCKQESSLQPPKPISKSKKPKAKPRIKLTSAETIPEP